MENLKVNLNPISKIGGIYSKIVSKKILSEEERIIIMLQQAKDDWKRAEGRFQEVTENDLIDHTIYDLQSARTRYSYLMKQAKAKGIKIYHLNIKYASKWKGVYFRTLAIETLI